MNENRDIEIEITADGSATLYVKELDEHYHSVKGAIAESNHIYRDCAFLYRSDGTSLRLLEIGFGTGLNAAVTAMAANAQHPIHYITLKSTLSPRHYIQPSIMASLSTANCLKRFIKLLGTPQQLSHPISH